MSRTMQTVSERRRPAPTGSTRSNMTAIGPGPQGRRYGAAVHMPRLRLEQPLPGDRQDCRRARRQVVHDRRRSLRLRTDIAMLSTGTVSEAMLYAFDLLELDGQDPRMQPLGD
jgi:hypothetical protein